MTIQTAVSGAALAAAMLLAGLVVTRAQTPVAVTPVAAAITQTVTLVERLDVFTATSQTYTLSAAPVTTRNVKVFLNGLLMLQGADYTVSGQTVTFTGQSTAGMSAPVVQVFYWVAQ